MRTLKKSVMGYENKIIRLRFVVLTLTDLLQFSPTVSDFSEADKIYLRGLYDKEKLPNTVLTLSRKLCKIKTLFPKTLNNFILLLVLQLSRIHTNIPIVHTLDGKIFFLFFSFFFFIQQTSSCYIIT